MIFVLIITILVVIGIILCIDYSDEAGPIILTFGIVGLVLFISLLFVFPNEISRSTLNQRRDLIIMRDGASDPDDILRIDYDITKFNERLDSLQKKESRNFTVGWFIPEMVHGIERIERSFEVNRDE
jgi:hypothetical protein